MRRMLVCIAVGWMVLPTSAQPTVRHVLFDFDEGIEGWWGNAWGGVGTCEPSATDDAKFGAGALHCEVNGVVKGGSNTVSAWFPEDAEWRNSEWATISLWVKGDGSRDSVRLTIETGLEGEEHQTYSYSLPLDDSKWHKVEARLGSFWNRQGVPMDVSRIGRIMFGCRGTHSFDIDHIVLEAPQRPVPLEPIGRPQGINLSPTMTQFEDGRCVIRFDPTPLAPKPAAVVATLTLGGNERQVKQQLPPGRPSDEAALDLGNLNRNGKAQVALEALRPNGDSACRATYSFSMVAAEEPPDPTPLGLVPAPKEISLAEGTFSVDTEAPVRLVAGEDFDPAGLNLLSDQLEAWLGAAPRVGRGAKAGGGPSEIALGPDAPPLSRKLAGRLEKLPREGYVLDVTQRGARIAANDSRGLVNGVCTLLQAVESHYARTFELAAPAMEVVDWPSLPIRAVSIPLPTNRWGYPNDAPVDPEFFVDFLRETVVRNKLNMVVLIVEQAMQYESHPKVSGPAAWSKETVKLIFDTLRRYGVEPVPLCNSLGHATWCAIPYRELAEDGDEHQFCTSNPDTKRILLDIYQEIVDLVHPKHFHIGMDEIRWKTYQLPEEERCKLCAGKDKRDIFVEWVQMLHDFFTKQGVEVMMWGDMLLPEHNGGVPYHLADTVDRLPKDIIICNWSTALAPTSSHWFQQRGFRVIKANSRGATLAEDDWITGNMMGIWSKVPWRTEGTGRKSGNYTYPSIVESAEYSWNFWPDLFNPAVPLTNDFFRARPLAQWRIAADPVPRAKPPEAIPLAGGTGTLEMPPGEAKFGGLTFGTERAVVAPDPGQEARVEIGRPVAALYFLHAAELPDRQAMVEALKPSKSWQGVRIGSYEIRYASGETASLPIRYPMELRTPQPGWCRVPLAYRALGVYPDACEPEGTHLYAVQWINPRRDDPVESVTLKAADAPARPILAGLAIQQPAE